MTINELKSQWQDTDPYHTHINDLFCQLVNQNQELKSHRDFVEVNGFGFGERAFHWLWKLLIDEMPQEFEFLEIGLYRGASLSVIELIAKQQGKLAWRYGVSPLSTAGDYPEFDYAGDIAKIHDGFGLNKDYTIYKGLSTDNAIIEQAYQTSPYDIIYIDGSHTYDDVLSDLANYEPMVKLNGYLIMDDCNKELNMPHGFFRGHEEVTKAKQDWFSEQSDFQFVFSVVHISVFKRIK